MRITRTLLALIFVALPSVTTAQDARESHFGVIFTFAPEAKADGQFKWLFESEPERIDVRSRDVEIGFVVRGRELGGDWGVSYVQKAYKQGSTLDSRFEDCFQQCFTYGTLDIMQDVQMHGLAVHKFAPFVTIKRRVQIGLTFGGGIAWAKGTGERHEFSTEVVPPNRTVQTETVTQVDGKELFVEMLDPMPIWKVELTGAVLLAPGLKVRAGGGLNYMNYPQFSVSAVYLFGSRP